MENWSASLTTVLAKPIGHITADSENACKATFVLCIGYAHLPIYVVQNSPPNSQNQMFYKVSPTATDWGLCRTSARTRTKTCQLGRSCWRTKISSNHHHQGQQWHRSFRHAGRLEKSWKQHIKKEQKEQRTNSSFYLQIPTHSTTPSTSSSKKRHINSSSKCTSKPLSPPSSCSPPQL